MIDRRFGVARQLSLGYNFGLRPPLYGQRSASLFHSCGASSALLAQTLAAVLNGPLKTYGSIIVLSCSQEDPSKTLSVELCIPYSLAILLRYGSLGLLQHV